MNPVPAHVNVPGYLAPVVRAAVESGRPVEERDYDHAPPLTDDHNIYSVLSVGTNMRFRKLMQSALPAGLYKS